MTRPPRPDLRGLPPEPDPDTLPPFAPTHPAHIAAWWDAEVVPLLASLRVAAAVTNNPSRDTPCKEAP